MKKIILVVLAALPFLAMDVSASNALKKDKGHYYKHDPKPPKKHPTKKVADVPEINGASAALAFGLLGGIVAIRRERNKLAVKK